MSAVCELFGCQFICSEGAREQAHLESVLAKCSLSDRKKSSCEEERDVSKLHSDCTDTIAVGVEVQKSM